MQRLPVPGIAFGIACLILFASCTSDESSPAREETARVAPVSAPLPAPDEPDLVIRGGTLIDMIGDEPSPVAVKGIVVREGNIARIISAGSTDPLPDAPTVIDAGSGYILPGYFDAHVHFRPWLPEASIWKRASLHYGITSLFDTGPCGDICAETGQQPNEWIRAYKTYMNASTDGPSLYITGRRIMDVNGAHPQGEKVASREEIVSYMDSLVELGVDGVKVESTLPPDLRAMVVEEAGARGLPVVGHSKDAYETMGAGMKFIEHMWPIANSLTTVDPGEPFFSPQHDYLIDMEEAPGLIRDMVDNGVYINPTMLGRYGFFAEILANGRAEDARSMEFGGLYSDMPERYRQGIFSWWARADNLGPDTLETYRQGHEQAKRFLKLFSESGGRILPATDSGADKLVGVTLHRELRMLAAAGITPYRLLLGVTRWPAEMTGKDDIIGTIAEGKHADIIILGSNPVEDIENSDDIRYVIKRGDVARVPGECSMIIPPMSMTCG